MKNFTLNIWRKALTAVVLFVTSVAAFAADFEPAPTTFNVTDLNGTYDVTFVGCQKDNLFLDLINVTDYVLVDAKGEKVPYSFVVPEMKDDYTVSITVANVENAAAGTYYIKVPAQAFGFLNMVFNDAFDVTLNLSNGTDPVNPDPDPDPEIDPQPLPQPGDAIFTLDDHKADTSIYFREGDILESNGAGVLLKFGRVGVDAQDYPYCYKSNGGFVQFKDCSFTISAPMGVKIKKVVFVDGAPTSITYDPDNFVAPGYADGVWTGDAQSVTFSTKEEQYPIYEYDEEGNEYITGYTTSMTAARIAKIFVTLEGVLDGINSIDAAAPVTIEYDLAGRRVNVAKGVTIAGGKKVIR